MRTVVFFLFCTFISIACLETALGAKHPMLLYTLGFGIWGLFAWYCAARNKRQAQRRDMERQFNEFMRSKYRKF